VFTKVNDIKEDIENDTEHKIYTPELGILLETYKDAIEDFTTVIGSYHQ
jgi:hypothetical protein